MRKVKMNLTKTAQGNGAARPKRGQNAEKIWRKGDTFSHSKTMICLAKLYAFEEKVQFV
jgi:hypothetical protein